MNDKMTQHEWDLAHDDASRLHTALTGFDDHGQGETAEQRATKYSRALDHVSTQWVQLHQEISIALGLDFEPNEDIERYTEAIAALRSQVATLTGERDAVSDALSLERKKSKLVHTQLGNMLFNLKQDDDMKRVTRSLEAVMDSVGWDKS